MPKDWYNLPESEVFEELGSSKKGLTSREARKRLQKYGRNVIKRTKGVSPFQVFINQFKDLLILILITAAFISFLVGHHIDFYLITAIVVANGFFGFAQDWKAERSIEALRKMASPKALVLRNGRKKEVASKEVAPGDVLLLEQGSGVEADARVIEQHNLRMDESALTGESEGVDKHTDLLKGEVDLAEQENMVFKHTNVVRGRGRAIVVSTGMKTEIGKVAKKLEEVEKEKTPFEKEVDSLGKKLGIFIVLISALIVPISVLLHGTSLLKSFLTAIALAVAAVPEGLPAVVTLALALGTKKMLRKSALVRKLPVVESLGSVDVVCADKTGTLTEDRMVVEKIYVNEEEIAVTGGFSGKGEFLKDGKKADTKNLELILTAGVLCNDSEIQNGEIIGDPTEAALIQPAQKAGLRVSDLKKEYKRTKEIPFSSKRKQMTTVHDRNGKKTAFLKGAPEVVLEECNRYMVNGKVKKMTEKKKKEFLDKNRQFAENALRVLGFACKEVSPRELKEEEREKEIESDLVFLGLQGMIDPPRKEVKDSIQTCRKAGIRVVMITGDNPTTARAIGKELGFKGKTLTGKELDKLSKEKFKDKVEGVDIYARVSPSHKVDILDALKENGHIVAMTGDGVNDAPSLKRSDVGVSMGVRGTDVAQQASDMVLLDDNFSSIKDAIAEGRGIFDNIRKFVNYLLSANVGEVLLVFLASLFGLGLPLTAAMLLWINLLTDGLPALALGADPKSRGIMEREPRKKGEGVINSRMTFSIFGIGILIALIILFLFLSIPDLQYAQTIAFTSLVVFELVRIYAIRSRYNLPLLSNKWLGFAITSSIVLQMLVLYTPLSVFFGVIPLGFDSWLLILTALALFGILTWVFIKIEDRIFGRG